jgi:hypothetical protein
VLITCNSKDFIMTIRSTIVVSLFAVAGGAAAGAAALSVCGWIITAASFGAFLTFVLWCIAAFLSLDFVVVGVMAGGICGGMADAAIDAAVPYVESAYATVTGWFTKATA